MRNIVNKKFLVDIGVCKEAYELLQLSRSGLRNTFDITIPMTQVVSIFPRWQIYTGVRNTLIALYAHGSLTLDMLGKLDETFGTGTRKVVLPKMDAKRVMQELAGDIVRADGTVAGTLVNLLELQKMLESFGINISKGVTHG